jgi:hypothetical protein
MERVSRALRVALSVLLGVVGASRTAAAQAQEFWIYDQPAGVFHVIDDAGAPVRDVAFAWPHVPQFLVTPDGSTVYLVSGTNGFDNRAWRLDVATGTTTFLFNAPWALLTGFLPDQPGTFLSSGSDGEIRAYDTLTSQHSVWHDNDLAVAQVGYNTFRYDLALADDGTAVVRAGHAGAGGDGLFLARVCATDATHHLCDFSVFANPSGGSSSWDTTATGAAIDRSGRYVFYRTQHGSAPSGFWRRDRQSGVESLVWPHGPVDAVQTSDTEVFFSSPVPGGSGRAIYGCGIVSLVCRRVSQPDISVNYFRAIPAATPDDTTPPQITCAAADGVWHGQNVALSCTAADAGAGLADPADAAFTLATTLADGDDAANAATGSREVCDLEGNCATAGPIDGNRIDRRAPSITIASPAAASYVLGTAVTASYGCADSGSGMASCLGPVASGGLVPTSAVGAQTFAVAATDAVGNASQAAVSYSVGFGVCVLYDQTKGHKSGSTIPIKVQLCDAAGGNVSSSAITVTATSVVLVSTEAPIEIEDSGNANPDHDFRFDAGLGGSGGYVFNLKLTGYGQGTYAMTFLAAGDATPHTVTFRVK